MRYRSLSSIQPYGVVPAHSHKVSRVSWYSGSCCPHSAFTYGAVTLYGRSFQDRSAGLIRNVCSPNPGMHASRFGLFRFRSPLLTESIVFFLFLRLLRCFSSPGSLRIPMDSVYGGGGFLRRVSPFRYLRIYGYLLLPAALRLLRCFSSPGSLRIPMDSVYGGGGFLRRVSPFRYLRIYGYLLLPAAFRSLSRLSSALSAKASSLRSLQLNLSNNNVSSTRTYLDRLGEACFHKTVEIWPW